MQYPYKIYNQIEQAALKTNIYPIIQKWLKDWLGNESNLLEIEIYNTDHEHTFFAKAYSEKYLTYLVNSYDFIGAELAGINRDTVNHEALGDHFYNRIATECINDLCKRFDMHEADIDLPKFEVIEDWVLLLENGIGSVLIKIVIENGDFWLLLTQNHVNKLLPSDNFEHEEVEGINIEALRKECSHVDIDLTTELAQLHITMETLGNIMVGDVVMLEDMALDNVKLINKQGTIVCLGEYGSSSEKSVLKLKNC